MPLIHGERDPLLDCRPVVQVPAPLTRERAQAILERAVEPTTSAANPEAEVMIGDDVESKLGWTVRVVHRSGAYIVGPLSAVATRKSHGWEGLVVLGCGWSWSEIAHVYLVTEPPNPDADLIDDLAHDLHAAWERCRSWGDEGVPDTDFDDLARKVIERVRAEA